MKIKLLLLIVLMSVNFSWSQGKSFWQRQSKATNQTIKASKQNLPKTQTYGLSIEGLKQALVNVPKRNDGSKSSNVILSFPDENGQFERFRIVEASVLHPDLAEQFPDIKSYAGQGVDDPTAVIRFSISPLGFQSMRLSANKPAAFIEAYTEDLSQYTVFTRSQRLDFSDDFECTVTDKMNNAMDSGFGSFNNWRIYCVSWWNKSFGSCCN